MSIDYKSYFIIIQNNDNYWHLIKDSDSVSIAFTALENPI